MNAIALPKPSLIRQALAAAALASTLFVFGCSDSTASLLAKAKESIEKNEPKAAEIHLKNLLQKEDSAEARFLLGTVHLKSGDLPSAEKELRRAQEAGFDPGRLVVPLVDTLLQLGQAQKAIDEAGKASPADATGKARLAMLVGSANLALGKTEDARISYEAALAADPGNIPAKLGLIRMRAGLGDLDGATIEIDKVLAEHASSTEAMMLKGELEQAFGRRKEAREWYSKVAQTDPKDRNSLTKILTLDLASRDLEAAEKSLEQLKARTGAAPVTMQLQAMLQLQKGEIAAARQSIDAALRAAPNYLPVVALGAEIYLRDGALEQAERLSRQVLERAPNTTQGYRLLATTQMRMNAPDKALQTLQPAIDKGAKDPAIYTLAGEAALRMNDAKKSAGFFDRAIELDPSDPRKQTGLAFAHIAGGERERGIAELERISAASPTETRADFALVATHLRARQFDKALVAIDRLEKKEPESAVVATLRGAALIGKGDEAGARKAYELALNRDPKHLPAVNSLAALDIRANKREDARKRYDAFLAKNPGNVQAMLTLAQLIEQTTPRSDAKAAEEALALLKKARETEPGSIPANLALSAWYVSHNQTREAIPLLQQTLATNPDNVQVLDALGTVYLRSDQDALGMETLEKILRVRPDDAMLQVRMGQLKLSRNDVPGAMANFRKAVDLQPKAIEPKLAMAAAHMRTGHPEDARRIANALQVDAPKNPAGFLLKGDIAMSERKFADAAGEYRKALALQKAAPIEVKLHQAVAASGNLAEADSMLGAMLRQHPDDLTLRAYAGEHEVGRKRWNEAIAHYERVLSKQPGNALVLNNTAWAMHETKNPKALETAEKALAAAPDNPAVQDTAGVILMAAGKTERGLELLRKAVATAPKAAALRLHLAEALASTGDKAGARAEVEKLLQDNPEGQVAEQARALQKQL